MAPLTDSEEARRRQIMEWAQQQDGVFQEEGNSVQAEKLFLANSAVIWCLKQLREEKLKADEAQGYIFFVKKYIEGALDMSWEDGVLCVSTLND